MHDGISVDISENPEPIATVSPMSEIRPVSPTPQVEASEPSSDSHRPQSPRSLQTPISAVPEPLSESHRPPSTRSLQSPKSAPSSPCPKASGTPPAEVFESLPKTHRPPSSRSLPASSHHFEMGFLDVFKARLPFQHKNKKIFYSMFTRRRGVIDGNALSRMLFYCKSNPAKIEKIGKLLVKHHKHDLKRGDRETILQNLDIAERLNVTCLHVINTVAPHTLTVIHQSLRFPDDAVRERAIHNFEWFCGNYRYAFQRNSAMPDEFFVLLMECCSMATNSATSSHQEEARKERVLGLRGIQAVIQTDRFFQSPKLIESGYATTDNDSDNGGKLYLQALMHALVSNINDPFSILSQTKDDNVENDHEFSQTDDTNILASEALAYLFEYGDLETIPMFLKPFVQFVDQHSGDMKVYTEYYLHITKTTRVPYRHLILKVFTDMLEAEVTPEILKTPHSATVIFQLIWQLHDLEAGTGGLSAIELVLVLLESLVRKWNDVLPLLRQHSVLVEQIAGGDEDNQDQQELVNNIEEDLMEKYDFEQFTEAIGNCLGELLYNIEPESALQVATVVSKRLGGEHARVFRAVRMFLYSTAPMDRLKALNFFLDFENLQPIQLKELSELEEDDDEEIVYPANAKEYALELDFPEGVPPGCRSLEFLPEAALC
ncbi:hypothetical protein DFS34DRAFT_621241 [Phlyctochytrium arcticum]|nr:hypothetical protein DFS34DRAFT_621241 [Phlyctochytrium arcticum]